MNALDGALVEDTSNMCLVANGKQHEEVLLRCPGGQLLFKHLYVEVMLGRTDAAQLLLSTVSEKCREPREPTCADPLGVPAASCLRHFAHASLHPNTPSTNQDKELPYKCHAPSHTFAAPLGGPAASCLRSPAPGATWCTTGSGR